MSLLSRHVELYDFYQGNRHWRYSDGDRPVVVAGTTHAAVTGGLKRGRIIQSAEPNKGSLDIEAPQDLGLLELFRPVPPVGYVHLNLKRVRTSDGLVTKAWQGVISGINDADGEAAVQIRCVSLATPVSARTMRRPWQVPCPLQLYSQGLGQCNVNPDDYRTTAVLSDAGGVLVKAGAFAAHGDNWFSGGYIQWQDGLASGIAYIVSQIGDTLILLTPTTLRSGMTIDAFPGCDHTLVCCNDKFNNALNHGGQHTSPIVNPFGADPVF